MIKGIIATLIALICVPLCQKKIDESSSISNSFFKGDIVDDFETCESSMYPDATFIENKYFFDNVSTYDNNTDGTCGLVSAQLILNYFDTFYDDRLIDERYDELCVINSTVFDPSNCNTSPGSGNSSISGDTSSLGSVLMDLTLEEYPDINFNVGMIASQVERILDKYTTMQGLSFSSQVTTLPGNLYNNHIQSYIDNDLPIICGVPWHFVVVYGYDDDYFYFDTGYHETARIQKSSFHAASFGICVDYELTGDHYHSDNYYHNLSKTYYCGCGESHYKRLTMEKADWGFEQQYFFYTKNKNFIVNGLSFSTSRLRTGYIEETAINLSPRRSGAGFAIFDIVLPKRIKQFDARLGWWSNHEMQNDGAALIMYEWDGDWLSGFVNLLQEDLPLSKNSLSKRTYFMVEESYGIRFYLMNTPIGDRNLGRLCLGELNIEYCTD